MIYMRFWLPFFRNRVAMITGFFPMSPMSGASLSTGIRR